MLDPTALTGWRRQGLLDIQHRLACRLPFGGRLIPGLRSRRLHRRHGRRTLLRRLPLHRWHGRLCRRRHGRLLVNSRYRAILSGSPYPAFDKTAIDRVVDVVQAAQNRFDRFSGKLFDFLHRLFIGGVQKGAIQHLLASLTLQGDGYRTPLFGNLTGNQFGDVGRNPDVFKIDGWNAQLEARRLHKGMLVDRALFQQKLDRILALRLSPRGKFRHYRFGNEPGFDQCFNELCFLHVLTCIKTVETTYLEQRMYHKQAITNNSFFHFIPVVSSMNEKVKSRQIRSPSLSQTMPKTIIKQPCNNSDPKPSRSH